MILGVAGLSGCAADEEETRSFDLVLETAAPYCVEAAADGSVLHLSVPAGFRDLTASSVFEQLWVRPDPSGRYDAVALDAFGGRAKASRPDYDLIQTSMNQIVYDAPTDLTQAPGFKVAYDAVPGSGQSEVTWTDTVDGTPYTGLVALVTVDGGRFTVSLLASTDEFAERRTALLDSVGHGSCPD